MHMLHLFYPSEMTKITDNHPNNWRSLCIDGNCSIHVESSTAQALDHYYPKADDQRPLNVAGNVESGSRLRFNHVGKVSCVNKITSTLNFARPIEADNVDVKDFNSIEWQDDRQPAIAMPTAAPAIAKKIVGWRMYFASIGTSAGGVVIPRSNQCPVGDNAVASSAAALFTFGSFGDRADAFGFWRHTEVIIRRLCRAAM